jgi:predicted TIM-barrel fold metal-dependent hydrolase
MSDPTMIDADAHVTEPVEIWETTAPKGREREVPHYETDADGFVAMWIGEDRVSKPRKVTETEYYAGVRPTAVNDARLRLEYMDSTGFWGQVLYPGVAGTVLGRLLSIKDAKLLEHCVRVYNDWLADWARPSGGRLIPIALLPLQDVKRSVAELERSVANGHRGVLFPHRPQEMGLPLITDPVWDPIWQACGDAKVPLTFHGGFGDDLKRQRLYTPDWRSLGQAAAASIGSITAFLDNMDVLMTIMFSSILPRFPDLKIASAESGFGYIPFLLEAADWHFHATDMRKERPEFELLPSEYFRRQVYTTFWFERSGPGRLLDIVGPDHLMFETDFPHRTSLYGQAQTTGRPLADIVAESVECIPQEYRARVLWGNAKALFGLSGPTPTDQDAAAVTAG